MEMKSNLTTGRVPDFVPLRITWIRMAMVIIAWMRMVMAMVVMMVMKTKTSMRWIMKWVRLR